MTLKTEDLRSFQILAEQMHFGRAAEILHVSQPALSKQIHRLENQIGGDLLLRRTHGLHLTSAGKMLLKHAAKVLESSDTAERMTRLALTGVAGSLRIGFGCSILARGLPKLISQFRQRYPDVDLVVQNMSSSDQTKALIDRKIDVGFVRLPTPSADIETRPIITERLMLALRDGDSYDLEKGLTAFRSAPFIIPWRRDSVSFYDHFLRTCRAAGFEPEIYQEVDVFFTVLNLVRAGLGVSLVPSAIRLMHIPQISFAETKVSAAEWHVGIAWHRHYPKSAAAENFIRLADQYITSEVC